MAMSEHNVNDTHVLHMPGLCVWTNKGMVHDEDHFIVQDIEPGVDVMSAAAEAQAMAAAMPRCTPMPKATPKPKPQGSKKERSKARRGM